MLISHNISNPCFSIRELLLRPTKKRTFFHREYFRLSFKSCAGTRKKYAHGFLSFIHAHDWAILEKNASLYIVVIDASINYCFDSIWSLSMVLKQCYWNFTFTQLICDSDVLLALQITKIVGWTPTASYLCKHYHRVTRYGFREVLSSLITMLRNVLFVSNRDYKINLCYLLLPAYWRL